MQLNQDELLRGRDGDIYLNGKKLKFVDDIRIAKTQKKKKKKHIHSYPCFLFVIVYKR